MKELESYSIDELEELTGFDRRTVSYYISEGLLPKVGRRGPKTRYPREFVDRLKFIQRAKDLQDTGKLPSATLGDMAIILDGLTAEEIVEGGKSNKRLLEIFAAVVDEPEEGDVLFSLSAADVDSQETFGADDWEASKTTLSAKREPGMVSASKRRAMHQQRAGMVADEGADFDLAEPLAMQMRESPDSRIDDSLTEMREGTERGMQELTEMRAQLGQMRGETQRDLEAMQDLAQQVSEMRGLVRDEVGRLRSTLDELSYLRRTSDLDRGRLTHMQLQNRARIWADRHGIKVPRAFLKVARLKPGKTAQFWEFPVDPKIMMGKIDLTVLCEGRPSQDEEDFIALEITGRYLADVMRPALQNAGPRSVCQVSAEEADFLQGVNCPGVDLVPFMHGVKRRA